MAKTRPPIALIAVLLLAFAALAAPMAARAGAFFSNIEDLPVMPGLAELPGSAVAFDKPEGRIAEVAASGRVSPDEVLAFYLRTLPQLGWRAAGPRRFAREDERLMLDFARKGAQLTVRFSLSPG